ncbi:MAG: hypothetical protein H6860_05415 [Rhodospirillales bacterium]|nr:hypothetical protein [Rhodospirillales bacterium]
MIGRRISVQRAGREFKACCPFHNEKPRPLQLMTTSNSIIALVVVRMAMSLALSWLTTTCPSLTRLKCYAPRPVCKCPSLTRCPSRRLKKPKPSTI